MKTLLKIITSILFATQVVSCSDILETPVKFDVQVAPTENLTIDADGVIKAPVGTSITFNFSGEPDFISFSYEMFNATQATLSFTSLLGWNNDNDHTLQLYVSKSFPGLLKTNAQADAETIQNHQWINISNRCSFPTTKNESAVSTVSLDEYKGDSIVIAFKYETINNDGFQPMWTIADLTLDNIVTKTGENALSMLAATMLFTPFDMNNLETAYETNTSGGVWDISTPKTIKIRQTAAGRALNKDWLISKKIYIPTGKTEKGAAVAVKNVTDRVGSYTYLFDENGEYVITFKASNYNYRNNSSTEKKIRIIIEN